jgi:hypothetical protein
MIIRLDLEFQLVIAMDDSADLSLEVNLGLDVVEHENCCTCPSLDEGCLIPSQLVLVQWMLPIHFIHKVVVIHFNKEVSHFAWILLDTKVVV